MIHRICFDGHFSSIKTLVEKLRRCFQVLPHLLSASEREEIESCCNYHSSLAFRKVESM